MAPAAPAPVPAAGAGWWEHVNGWPAWQDGIFCALAVLYGLVAVSSFIQVARIQHRVPEYGWTTQKVFQFLNFVVNGARCSSFAFRCQVQQVNPQIFQHVILDLPGLAFFTTYAMLALFWAEISYQARGLEADGLRSGFYTINCVIYAMQARTLSPHLILSISMSSTTFINRQNLKRVQKTLCCEQDRDLTPVDGLRLRKGNVEQNLGYNVSNTSVNRYQDHSGSDPEQNDHLFSINSGNLKKRLSSETDYTYQNLESDGYYYSVTPNEVLLWLLLWWNPNPSMLVVSKLFIAGLSFFAALGFLLYGGRLYLMLKSFPIESKGRQQKLREVGRVGTICFCCFLARCIMMCFNAFDKEADLDVLDHPILNLFYYLLVEILPSSLVLYILRRIPSKLRLPQYHPLSSS